MQFVLCICILSIMLYNRFVKLKSFKIILISLLFLIFFNGASFGYADCYYKVLKVLDGDTFYIDFNSSGTTEANERVRVNGIDAFEIKMNATLQRQAKKSGISDEDALRLGYLGKKYAEKTLLNKKVKISYSAKERTDKYGRAIVSIYYDCDKEGNCKSYEKEILSAGYATIYNSSNLKKQLQPYLNLDKIKENVAKVQNLELVVLNKKSGAYHKIGCEYGWMARQFELIKKPRFNFRKHPASCCHNVKPHHKHKDKKYKPITKAAQPNAQEANIQLFFLSPLEQKEAENKCTSNACKTLIYNIDNAKESIDFAIYGIREQDAVFNALVQAQKRGVKIRWVTDLTEKGKNIYTDTYRLMKALPNYSTDYDSAESRNIPDYKYKLDYQGALMHNKFFIFDNRIVFTGSTNISNTCLTGFNSNVAVLIDSEEVANAFKQEFEQMYEGKFHNEKSPVINNENIKIGDSIVSVYFSPVNKAGTTQVIPQIQKAKSYIYVPAFYLTRLDIIEELIKAKERGVEVKIIVDETSVKGKYVNVDYIIDNGVELKVEHWQGKMHMKSMIIDDSTLVIGSMNFTKQGESMNDENCLIIKNVPALASAYKAHFLELWNSIK